MFNVKYILTILTYFITIRLVFYGMVSWFAYNSYSLFIIFFMLYKCFVYIILFTNIIDVIALRINNIINKPIDFIIVYTTRLVVIGFSIYFLMLGLLLLDIPFINLCLSFLHFSPLYFITSNLLYSWVYIGTGGPSTGGSNAGPSTGGPSGGPSGGGPNGPNNITASIYGSDNIRHTDRRSRSVTPIENDVDYWETQSKIFNDGLNSLDKPDEFLTNDEYHAKRELIRLNLYTKDQMMNAYLESKRNADYPTDPESIRRQNVLNSVSRNAEMQTESYKFNQEMARQVEIARRESQLIHEARLAESAGIEKAIIYDCIGKLRRIAVYNLNNNASVPASGSVPGYINSKLTQSENDCLVNVINRDPHAPLEVRSRIINGTIQGKISIDSVLFNYLQEKTR